MEGTVTLNGGKSGTHPDSLEDQEQTRAPAIPDRAGACCVLPIIHSSSLADVLPVG